MFHSSSPINQPFTGVTDEETLLSPDNKVGVLCKPTTACCVFTLLQRANM